MSLRASALLFQKKGGRKNPHSLCSVVFAGATSFSALHVTCPVTTSSDCSTRVNVITTREEKSICFSSLLLLTLQISDSSYKHSLLEATAASIYLACLVRSMISLVGL